MKNFPTFIHAVPGQIQESVLTERTAPQRYLFISAALGPHCGAKASVALERRLRCLAARGILIP